MVVEWDVPMTRVWDIAEGDLLSPDVIAELQPGLNIEKAQAKQLENILQNHTSTTSQGNTARAAFVRARSPLQVGALFSLNEAAPAGFETSDQF